MIEALAVVRDDTLGLTDVLVAQSLFEYGALHTAVSTVQAAGSAVEDWVFQQDPRVVMAVGAVVLLWFVGRAFRR